MSTPLPKLAAPARRALAAAKIGSLEDLRVWSKARVGALHGMGPNAMNVLGAAMQAAGVQFADEA